MENRIFLCKKENGGVKFTPPFDTRYYKIQTLNARMMM